MSIGSKLQVWNGTATRTAGGLTKSDLMQSPRTGKIISKAQYSNGVRQAKNLGITPKRRGAGLGRLVGMMSRPRRAKGSGVLSGLLGSIGLGLKKRRRVKRKGAGIKRKKTVRRRRGGYVSLGGYVSKGGKRRGARRGRKMKGSGAFDDFMTGFTAPIKLATSLAPLIL